MNTTIPMIAAVWIGLDVSKDSIDACLLRHNGKTHFKTFSNEETGHAKLLRWVQHLAPSERCHTKGR